MLSPIAADRAHPAFFWLGVAAVTLGVAFHLPMFIAAAPMNFHLAGMPVDWRMLIGMALIGAGTVAGFYGLLPPAPRRAPPTAALASAITVPPLGDPGKLRWVHWQLMLVLTLALVIELDEAGDAGLHRSRALPGIWLAARGRGALSPFSRSPASPSALTSGA